MSDARPGNIPAHEPYAGQFPHGRGGPLGDGLDMYGRVPGTVERPPTVSVAASLTQFFSAFALPYVILPTVWFLAHDKDDHLQDINGVLAQRGLLGEITPEDAYALVLAQLLLLTLWPLVAIVLAHFARLGSKVARFLLALSAAGAVYYNVSSTSLHFTVFGIDWGALAQYSYLVACLAVVVLLFSGGAGSWYSGRRRY